MILFYVYELGLPKVWLKITKLLIYTQLWTAWNFFLIFRNITLKVWQCSIWLFKPSFCCCMQSHFPGISSFLCNVSLYTAVWEGPCFLYIAATASLCISCTDIQPFASLICSASSPVYTPLYATPPVMLMLYVVYYMNMACYTKIIHISLQLPAHKNCGLRSWPDFITVDGPTALSGVRGRSHEVRTYTYFPLIVWKHKKKHFELQNSFRLIVRCMTFHVTVEKLSL